MVLGGGEIEDKLLLLLFSSMLRARFAGWGIRGEALDVAVEENTKLLDDGSCSSIVLASLL
jgi:hypothetical protein